MRKISFISDPQVPSSVLGITQVINGCFVYDEGFTVRIPMEEDETVRK